MARIEVLKIGVDKTEIAAMSCCMNAPAGKLAH